MDIASSSNTSGQLQHRASSSIDAGIVNNLFINMLLDVGIIVAYGELLRFSCVAAACLLISKLGEVEAIPSLVLISLVHFTKSLCRFSFLDIYNFSR